MEEGAENLKRRIDVLLDEIWTTIADTRPEKMLGYGKMSKRDEDYEFIYSETSEYGRILIV